MRLARHFGIEGQGPRALARLRTLPASRLVDGLNMATMRSAEQDGYVGGPIRADGLYQGKPTQVYAAHPRLGNHVPVMIGANSGDLSFLRAKSLPALLAMFGPKAAQARAAFDPGERLTLRQAAWRVGAMHASEIPYVFDTVRAYSGDRTSAQDERVARTMYAYWVAFAKTGKPDPMGLPAWPRYRARTDRLMNFTGHGPVPEADPWRVRLDLSEWYSERRRAPHAAHAPESH